MYMKIIKGIHRANAETKDRAAMVKKINALLKSTGTGLTVSRQLWSLWTKNNWPAPQFCPAIHEVTGIPLSELRADIYPPRIFK